MWRVQGFVGRVLHRYHGNNTLRLPQNHHVEDEIVSASASLSTAQHSFENRSQKDDRDRKRKNGSFHFGCTDLPRYTAMDAVGWGAVAVLFMQICRRIHSRFSSGTEPSASAGTLTAPSALQKCSYRILLETLSRHHVLPGGKNVLCLQSVPERQIQNQSQSSGCSSDQLQQTDSSSSDHQGEHLHNDSPEDSVLFREHHLQNDAKQDNAERKEEEVIPDEKSLTEAVLKLSHVADMNVPVILNIIGLESAKRENYEEAFPCFLAAAQHGYSKAQFNAGVCYEKGKGVGKNKEKALYYYRQAAAAGHEQAQYRCAKLLLTSRGHQSVEELNEAQKLLEKAAAAGLTKAQICLASVYSRDPAKHGSKSIQYLQMAAQSGDSRALFFLGQCDENGLGVQQNLTTAVNSYKQAGSLQANVKLNCSNETSAKAMRSVRSAPCFSVADSQQPLFSVLTCGPAALPLLPHSWSSGSLCAPPSSSPFTCLQLHGSSRPARSCQWTVGVG